jgi:hypothetical protein
MKLLPNLILAVGLTLGIFYLEEYLDKIYLESDISSTFKLHFHLYLLILICILPFYWKSNFNRIGSPIKKSFYLIIISGFILFFANRFELLINSVSIKEQVVIEYSAKLKGILWGQIGLSNLDKGEFDIISIRESEIKGLEENDKIKIEFKVGLFGIKYKPTIKKK